MDEPDRGHDEHPPPYVGAYDASSSSDSEDEVIEDEERRSSDYDEGGRRRHLRGGRHYESIRLQRAPGGTLQQADSCMVRRMDSRGCAMLPYM